MNYNYDIKQFDNGIKPNETIYSDRLFQFDSKKYNQLSQKHFENEGQYWGGRDPKK